MTTGWTDENGTRVVISAAGAIDVYAAEESVFRNPEGLVKVSVAAPHDDGNWPAIFEMLSRTPQYGSY